MRIRFKKVLMTLMFNLIVIVQPATGAEVSSVFDCDIDKIKQLSLQNDASITQCDVSKISVMVLLFCGDTFFNQPIGSWDVSRVENMKYMFSGAESFNQDLSQWCVSQFKKKTRGI